MSEVDQLQEAVDYIEDNIKNDLKCLEVAKHICMSTFHFQRLFSIICGYTVGEYIRNRRLALAAKEIQMSNKAIIEIALMFGYDTPEGFTRAFHRYYGVTPSGARDRDCVLPNFEKLSVQKTLLGGIGGMNDMTSYSKRGYYVKENAPVYFQRILREPVNGFKMYLAGMGISVQEMIMIFPCMDVYLIILAS